MSLSVIGTVAAVVIGGTSAFFSDSETSTGNTFTAGAIDLKVDSQQHYNNAMCTNGVWVLEPGKTATNPQYPVLNSACGGTWGQGEIGEEDGPIDIVGQKFFDFGDVKPGDSGENTVSLHVINNDAWMCATVSRLTNNENGINEPEAKAGDVTANEGELQQKLMVKIWSDNSAGEGWTKGDNVWQGQALEPVLYEGPAQAGTWALYDSVTGDKKPLAGSSTTYLGVAWSLPASTGNEVQTDSMTGDISFNVVQARNNADFKCSDGIATVVHQAGLETQEVNHLAAVTNGKWFFYDDVLDKIMTINQFGAGSNEMALIGGVEGAKMTLADATSRYNIATYKYKNVKLSDINTLKYRVYDATADSDKPYLHFNIDFNNSDTWQKRLVYVPTGLTTNTWTEVDALQGGAAMWTYSGALWPAGGSETGSTPGTTAKSWTSIKADYPNAETRSTDSWLGVRVGEPGPTGATGAVDWIQFNSEKTDFEN